MHGSETKIDYIELNSTTNTLAEVSSTIIRSRRSGLSIGMAALFISSVLANACSPDAQIIIPPAQAGEVAPSDLKAEPIPNITYKEYITPEGKSVTQEINKTTGVSIIHTDQPWTGNEVTKQMAADEAKAQAEAKAQDEKAAAQETTKTPEQRIEEVKAALAEAAKQRQQKISLPESVIKAGGKVKDITVKATGAEVIVIGDIQQDFDLTYTAGVEGKVVSAARVNASTNLVRILSNSGDYRWDFLTPLTSKLSVLPNTTVDINTQIFTLTYNPASPAQKAFESIAGGLPPGTVIFIGGGVPNQAGNISIDTTVLKKLDGTFLTTPVLPQVK